MATGNSFSHQKTEKNNKYLLKRFNYRREYYFYHEYFTNKYLLELDQKFVAKIFKINKNNYEIYYEFFPQKKSIGIKNAINYINLIKSIHRKSENKGLNLKLYAKESFRSIPQTFTNIEQRTKKLFAIKNCNNQELIEHLNNLNLFLNILKQNIISKSIYSEEKFNHADSGLHNCIFDDKGRLLLCDLEYAGLDSPIKQCIDYLLHPKNNNDVDSNQLWLNYFLNNCIHQKDIKYLKFYFSLFAVKWSIILLNEFIPEIWTIRIHASPLRAKNHDNILINQLKKSKIYLEAARKLIDNDKSTNLFSESEKLFISKSY